MRLAALSFATVALCLAGCGGTLVLHSETGTPAQSPAPAPETVPVRECRDLSRDEAIQVVAMHAQRDHMTRLRVEEVERKKNEWRVEMRGVDPEGHEVEVRARVDRRSGALKSYKLDDRHDDHGRHHQYHDGHDD